MDLLRWIYTFIRSMESSWAHKLEQAKLKVFSNIMDEDWKKGASKHFRSIRPPARESPSVFDIPTPGKVTRHRRDKNGPFWVTSREEPPEGISFVQFLNQRIPILEQRGNNLRLASPIAGPAEVDVEFIKVTANREEVFELTHTNRAKFWQAAPEVDEALLEQVLIEGPRVPTFSSTFNMGELKEALKALDVNKARGPDSWSNADLKQMPASFLDHLLQLLQTITDTSQWPESTLQATVSMLSKMDSSFEISQTRPIAVLSCLYRLWSKMVARKFITNALSHLPEGIQGNRPGASSKWVATYVQSLSERSMEECEDFSIMSLDLTKAYNLLSRKLLLRANQSFGTPESVCRTYFTFLNQVQRSFMIYGTLSPTSVQHDATQLGGINIPGTPTDRTSISHLCQLC